MFTSWVILFEAMTADPPDKNRRAVYRWVRIGHVLTAISAMAAGALGAFLADDYGPGAAMYWAITAGNTEPNTPHLPYPWLAFWLSMLVTAAGTVMLKGERAWLGAGVTLVSLGSLALILLPFWHIFRLVGAT